MKPKRILYIEDEPELREDLVLELVDAGYSVFEARDGAEGLEKILAGDIDLVFGDIQLPKLNGLELIEQARLGLAGKAPEFVLLTAYSDDEMRGRASDLGVRGFLVKPVDYDALLELCANILGEGR